MKKKKQSCAANRHKCRPVFLIEQELREAMNDAASCLRNRNYARHQQAMQRIARLKKELEDSRIDQQFHDDNRNMDRAAVPMLHELTHLPVIVDPSHATGINRLVSPMAMSATACNADGLIIEVHNDPIHALCDGAQSLRPEQFDVLMGKIREIRKVVTA